MDNLINLLLISVALAGGVFAYVLPSNALKLHKFGQVFSGAFLFALTVTHMLPELFAMVFGEHHYAKSNTDLHLVGVFILLGYFFQSIIEALTKGVEHGHLHMHDHSSGGSSAALLTGSLFVHGVLDGAILINPDAHGHADSHGVALFIGVLVHKIPVAFVLMYQLLSTTKSKLLVWVYFSIFVVSSPIGLLIGNDILLSEGDVYKYAVYVFAAITGNFLNITTTIFVESNMGHKLFSKNRLALIAGISLALSLQLIEVHQH